MRTRRLLGDQLGPHFLDDPGLEDPGGLMLLIESRALFARRRWHRRKAHLVLSALRYRAAELGERAESFRPGPTARRCGDDVGVAR